MSGPVPAWYERGLPHVWLPYRQHKTAAPPLPVVKTDGVRLFLEDGRALIDGTSSWWTACHGYNHPHLRAAVEEQLARMPHVMFGGLVHEPALKLARRLSDLLPGDLERVFFAESGSVSVEVAMKMAVQRGLQRGERGRTRFVSFRGGYHGDTFATMSVCDPDEGMHSLFQGALAAQHVVDLPRTEAQREAFDAFLGSVRHEVAAVLVEPLLQGAGGMRFHEPEVLTALRRSCDRHDVLLILDEIATGFGRTGTLFALEQAGIVPDIVCLSKALTGGMLPLSAAVARRHVFDAFLDDDPQRALQHGPTFMGNALACAAANASLDLFEREPRLAQVARIERQMREELEPCRSSSRVVDVRVMGAVGVVQVTPPVPLEALRSAFVSRGVFVRPFGDVTYVMPPFIIEPEDLRALTAAVVDVVEREL